MVRQLKILVSFTEALELVVWVVVLMHGVVRFKLLEMRGFFDYLERSRSSDFSLDV